MKRIFIVSLILGWTAFLMGQGRQAAPPNPPTGTAPCSQLDPSNFCQDGSGETLCYSSPVYSYPSEPRYRKNIVPLGASSYFPANTGDIACSPHYISPFGFRVKKVADRTDYVESINGERAAWNHAGGQTVSSKMGFYHSRGNSQQDLVFIDYLGDEMFTHNFSQTDFYPLGLPSYINPSKWKRIFSSIRWWQDYIIYPRGNELVKRKVSGNGLGPVEPLVKFGDGLGLYPDYVIGSVSQGGSFSYKIAGGDGNDINGGRLLISLVENAATNPTMTFVVLDLHQEKIVSQNITWGLLGSYNETFVTPTSSNPTFYSTPVLLNHMFSLPIATSDFDYAQVSASGLFVVSREGGQGFRLFDFNGNSVSLSNGSTIFPMTSHYDVGMVLVESNGSDKIRECVITKVNPGMATALNALPSAGSYQYKEGDLVALYWHTGVAGSNVYLRAMLLLEWDHFGNGDPAIYSGGQFSAVSDAQEAQTSMFQNYCVPENYPYRMFVAMSTANPDSDDNSPANLLAWGPYFGEIVELSLNHHDLVPRRIVHHFVLNRFDHEPDYANPIPGTSCYDPSLPICSSNMDCNTTSCYQVPDEHASNQPEIWMSPNGRRILFKSSGLRTDFTTNPDHNKQNLYMVEIPLRTCPTARNGSGGGNRGSRKLAEAFHNFSIYPNPIDQDYFLLKMDSRESTAFPAAVNIIQIDGRSKQVWRGQITPSRPIKVSIEDYSPGIYFVEIRNLESGEVEKTEKVILK
ncbi:MAG: T9SS type A sorting domain-containing protein [Bacteroidota bacterium]